jgi:Ca2+-binding RTX toxin-like protein
MPTAPTLTLFQSATDASGAPYYEIKPQYQNVYPYFRLYYADPYQVANFELVLTGYTGSVLAQFLAQQAQFQGTKSFDAAAGVPGTYIRIDFRRLDSGVGGQTFFADTDFINATGAAYERYIKDQDLGRDANGVLMSDANIAINTYFGGRLVAQSTRSIHQMGIASPDAYLRLTMMHEMLHLAYSNLGTNQGWGHLAVFTRLLASTGIDGQSIQFTAQDILADPVELEVYTQGLAHGDISGNGSDYLEGRVAAWERRAREAGLDTVGELKAARAAGTLRGDLNGVPIVPIVGSLGEYYVHKLVQNIFTIDASDLLGAFGSVIGRVIAGDNPVAQVVVSSALQTLLTSFGNFIEGHGALTGGVSVGGGLGKALEATLGGNFLQTLTGQGVGAISSYLVGQLADELGLEGAAGEIATSLGSRAVSQIVFNIAHPTMWVNSSGTEVAAGTSGATQVDRPWFKGIDSMMIANVVGSYIGTRLAMDLGNFDSYEGQIGAQVGSMYGSLRAAALLASNPAMFANPIVAIVVVAIVVFIDTFLGGLIGSMFAGKPRSAATVDWTGSKKGFEVGRVWAVDDAPEDGARALGKYVADVLDGVVVASGSTIVDAAGIRAGSYGTYKKDFAYWENGQATLRTSNAEAVVTHGIAIALSDLSTRLFGGNVYVKRALNRTLELAGVNATSAWGNAAGSLEVNTLLGNLATAQDYQKYLANKSLIDAIISEASQTGLAAGWLVTIAQAFELGLHKRAVSDWYGGWSLFLDERDGLLDGDSFTPANLVLRLNADSKEREFYYFDEIGNWLLAHGDTIDTASKDRILGSGVANTITVTGATVSSTSGLIINGAAPAAATYKIDVAALIDAGAGNDTVRAGDLGNDVLGGDGLDKLVGGKLDDWLFGQGGDDVLFAGNVTNITFAVTDTANQNIAIAVDGGNGDLLDGGDGNDRLYGGKGSEWLKGGAGVDWLFGGAGGDILEGGAGDDKGTDGSARLLGGAGTDQYVFGFGDGKDVIFDESDLAGTAGSTGDSYSKRVADIGAGTVARDWAGNGSYLADGSVKGGEDAIAFGPGISMRNLILQRSGTTTAPGQDLIIKLTAADANGVQQLTGDELTIKDWYESTRRVEWLRFADGSDIRIGDTTTYLIGTASSDVMIGTSGNDFIYGSGGNDQIRGLGGHDIGNGGAGNDFVAGDADNDWVMGESGDDSVVGGWGNDTVFGDEGNDFTYGGNGSDLVVGAAGNDEMVGGMGDDIFRVHRGDGQDILYDELISNWELVWQNNAYVNGYQQQADGSVTKFGVAYFDAGGWHGQYDFNLAGSAMYRHLGEQNAQIAKNSGVDSLEFGAGIDIQDLAMERNGDDLAIGIADENYTGRAMDAEDRVIIKDWYSVGATIENFVFLATGRHSVSGSMMQVGGEGIDSLSAGAYANVWLVGGGGNDTLLAASGTGNWLFGGAGDDTLTGAGVLFGQAGDDTFTVTGTGSTAYGGDGDDVFSGDGTFYGDDGDDTLKGTGTLDGGAGDDLLRPTGTTAVVITGGEGEDTVAYDDPSYTTGVQVFLATPSLNAGQAAGDTYSGVENITGSVGGDMLVGDAGANVLTGLAGDDVLIGGAGDDVYVWSLGSGSDAIRDHVAAGEQVVNAAGVLQPGFTTSWLLTGTMVVNGVTYAKRQLKVTKTATAEIVYQSRDGIDFVYVSGTAPFIAPPPSAWPYGNGQWLGGFSRTSASLSTYRFTTYTTSGGDDTLLIENAGLHQLIFTWSGTDLTISGDTGQPAGQITLVEQGVASQSIQSIEFADGRSFALSTLRLTGVAGTTGVDTMLGDAAVNTMSGGAGNDWLVGKGGNDVLNGDAGDDMLEGGAGADTLNGGADRVSAGLAIDPNDLASYGDTITYAASAAAVSIDLALRTASGGDAQGDIIGLDGTYASLENVTGSKFNDTLKGDARANRLIGGGGNDTLDGAAGDDVLVSTSGGRSSLIGGDGDDNLSGGHSQNGGNGNDLMFTTFAGDATFAGATLTGGAGNDRISAGVGADTLAGGTGDDIMDGGAGNDVLNGDGDNDTLVGGSGNDALQGGVGNDILAGGLGSDTLNGGADNDTYVFDANSGTDYISGAEGTDIIQISGVGPKDVWLVREGDHLKISVTGGDTVIYLTNYYAATGAARVKSIQTATATLYLDHAQSLIQAMTGSSPSAPPAAVLALIEAHWQQGDKTAPIVVDTALAATINVALTGNVGAVDYDQNITTYAVVDGPDKGTLSLNATTGAYTYTPTALGADSFIISVSDADGHVVQQTTSMTVGSFAPPNATLGLTHVQDIAATGQVVATFGAPGTGKVLEIVDNPNNWFVLSGSQLKLKTGFNIGFEALIDDPSAPWRTITDVDGDGQLEVSLAVSVRLKETATSKVSNPTVVYFRVEDQNQAPTISGATFTVSENAPFNTVIGSVSAADSDSQDYNRKLKYSLDTTSAQLFNIDQYTGAITVKGALNYESVASHTLTVTTRDRDGTGLSASAQLTVQVQNLAEAPVITSLTPTTGQNYAINLTDPDGVWQYNVSKFTIEDVIGLPEGHGFRQLAIMQSTVWLTENGSDRYLINLAPNSSTPQVGTLSASQQWSYYTVPDFVMRVRVTDTNGSQNVQFLKMSLGSLSVLAPIVLDLDGDGIEMVKRKNSQIQFDLNADGRLDYTGWVKADDGFLALDRNGDGQITNGDEIRFDKDTPFAVSDLEGLRAYDSNENGFLDVEDARYAEFLVWQDVNQDGVSQTGELRSLADQGVHSISLTLTPAGGKKEGAKENAIYGYSTYVTMDGSVRQVGDVILSFHDATVTTTVIDDPSYYLEHTDTPLYGVDQGVGDAAPGKTNRGHSGNTPAAYRGLANQQASQEGVPASEEFSEGANLPSPSQPEISTPASVSSELSAPYVFEASGGNQSYAYAPAAMPSALDGGLELVSRQTLLMVQALASFAPEPGAALDLTGSTSTDAGAMALLTSLPDLRAA